MKAATMFPKCKHNDHLEVRPTSSGPFVPIATTFVPVLECRNDRSYDQWGAVLTTGDRSADHLYLFPDAVVGLTSSIPVAVRGAPAGGGVAILHKRVGAFFVWRRVSIETANLIVAALLRFPPPGS